MTWLRRLMLSSVILVIAAVAIVYGWSEWLIRHDRQVRLIAIAADRSPAGIAEGARLTRIEGCMDCHGDGHGKLFVNAPVFAVITAPAYSQIVAREDDAVLARSIRQGVSGAGGALWIMPPHVRMADDDTARIMGYLRTLRPSPQDLPHRRSFGPLARLAMVLGRFQPTIRTATPAPAHRPADVGRYFATVTCLGCHDLDQPRPFGPDGEVAPPLAMMAGAYDDAAFVRLLRTGRGLSKPQLGTMSDVARSSLHALSDSEIAAIKAYLTGVSARPHP